MNSNLGGQEEKFPLMHSVDDLLGPGEERATQKALTVTVKEKRRERTEREA